MANLSIAVNNAQGEIEYWVRGEDEIHLVYPEEYVPGDKLVFTADEVPGFYIIRVDGTMDEAYVYLTHRRLEYAIPFERGNPLDMDRISYCPGSFVGKQHYMTIRKAREEENRNYWNLAKNVMDQHDDMGCYPHVHANAETKGAIAPLFSARNVIDGVLANVGHYPWPYQSWGINHQRDDAEIVLEFGRPVDMDELRLTTRADFPHDSWWTQGTISFSDGTSEVVKLGKKMEPQVFSIRRQGITWLKVGQLIKGDDSSPFPALTQIEVYGTNSLL